LVATASGLASAAAQNTIVTDGTTGVSLPLTGVTTASTGPASSFIVVVSPNIVSANFDASSSATSVLVEDGTGHTLVSGTMDARSSLLSGYPNGAGSFNGKFTVGFVAPSVLAMFGQVGFSPEGSVSATFAGANLSAGTLTATLGGGTVTIESAAPVSEPGTAGLAGVGLLLAGVTVRKRTRLN
jgi:hypothetical protein